eukprot:Sspe_Gene.99340::Locus_72853_Transcript_1_1_Confidence_1.000_Length_2747::g.99340::m.99340/K01768/E4.6.1.1; adenylate cyclase
MQGVRAVREGKGLTPDAQYMGKVGLPHIIDKLLRHVLVTQPASSQLVVAQIRKACDEELASVEGGNKAVNGDARVPAADGPIEYLTGPEDAVVDQLESLPEAERRAELRKLVRKYREFGKEEWKEVRNPPGLFAKLLSGVLQRIPGCTAHLHLHDRDNNVVYSPTKPEIRAPVGTGLVCRAFSTNAVQAGKPTAEDTSLLQGATSSSNVVAAPVACATSPSTVVAVITVTGDRTFSQNDIDVLQSLASSASPLMTTSRSLQEANESANQVDVLLDVARRLGSELEVNSLIRTIMQVSRDLLNADRSTLFLLDKENDELWSSVADGTSEIRIPKTAGIAGAVAVSGEPLNIPNAYDDSRFNQEIDKRTGYRTNSMLCMPMVDRQGGVIGVTQMINKKTGSAFGKDDQRLLGAFSAQAAVAIENSLLFKRTEESKDLFMSVLASIKNLIITLDNKGRVLTLNRDPEKFGIGITEETMRSKPYTEWFPKKDEGTPPVSRTQSGEGMGRRRSSTKGPLKLLCEMHWNGLLLEDIMECYKSGKTRHVSDFTYYVLDEATRNQTALTINYTIMALRDFDGNQKGVVISMEDISNEAQMMATLGKYMSPELAAAALEGGTQLGGQQLPVSVLFVDIRNFTGLSEAWDASEVVTTLNEYFRYMGGSVLDHGGIVDKYIGDAVMAVFGVPFPAADDAHRICKCALEMFRHLDKWNEQRKAGGQHEIRMGIGINTGEVVAGNIGFEKRMEYTVIGDGVNLASRMEGATKEYKTHILITEFTYEQVHDSFHCREVDCIRVVGKKQPVRIYELQGDTSEGDLPPERRKCNELYGKGLEYYKQRKWEDAKSLWVQAAQEGDKTAQALLPRVQLFLDDPHISPKEGWDGVWDMANK